MGRNTKIDRRRFLISSSAAALASASLKRDLQVNAPRNEESSRHHFDDSGQQTLTSTGLQRSFWSTKLLRWRSRWEALERHDFEGIGKAASDGTLTSGESTS